MVIKCKWLEDNRILVNPDIHTNDMKDIINGEWFTKTLPDSWKDETKTISQCKIWCGE